MKIKKHRLRQIIREEISRKIRSQQALQESSGVLVMKNRQLDEAAVLVLGGAIITAEMIAAALGISLAIVGTAWLIDMASELGWDYYPSEAAAREAISQQMPRVNPDLRLPASSGYRPTEAELAAQLALSATAQRLSAEAEQGSDISPLGPPRRMGEPEPEVDVPRRPIPWEWDDPEDPSRTFDEFWCFGVRTGDSLTYYYIDIGMLQTGIFGDLYQELGTRTPSSDTDEGYLDITGVGILGEFGGDVDIEISSSAIERMIDQSIAYAEVPWSSRITPFTAESEICDAVINTSGPFSLEQGSVLGIPYGESPASLGDLMKIAQNSEVGNWSLHNTSHDEGGNYGILVPITESGSDTGRFLVVMDEMMSGFSTGTCPQFIDPDLGGDWEAMP